MRLKLYRQHMSFLQCQCLISLSCSCCLKICDQEGHWYSKCTNNLTKQILEICRLKSSFCAGQHLRIWWRWSYCLCFLLYLWTHCLVLIFSIWNLVFVCLCSQKPWIYRRRQYIVFLSFFGVFLINSFNKNMLSIVDVPFLYPNWNSFKMLFFSSHSYNLFDIIFMKILLMHVISDIPL